MTSPAKENGLPQPLQGHIWNTGTTLMSAFIACQQGRFLAAIPKLEVDLKGSLERELSQDLDYYSGVALKPH